MKKWRHNHECGLDKTFDRMFVLFMMMIMSNDREREKKRSFLFFYLLIQKMRNIYRLDRFFFQSLFGQSIYIDDVFKKQQISFTND